jgi:CBS domain-containing protein
MKVSDVMSTGVCSIKADSSLLDAVRLMVQNRISALPVVGDNGDLVGIVTEGDLMRRAELDSAVHRPRWLEFFVTERRRAHEYIQSHARKIGDLMTREPFTIDADAPLDEAVSAMLRLKVRRLPVMREGKVVGIVSRSDLVRRLFQRLQAEDQTPLGDTAIADRIKRELQAQDWAPTGSVNVAVRKGVVELTGVVTSTGALEGLRVLIENIPGVTGLINKVTWVDPYSGVAVPPSGDIDPGR